MSAALYLIIAWDSWHTWLCLSMSVNLKKGIHRGFMKMKRPIDIEMNRCYTEINFSEVNLSILYGEGWTP